MESGTYHVFRRPEFSFAEHSAVDEEPRFYTVVVENIRRGLQDSLFLRADAKFEHGGVGHVAKSMHVAKARDDHTPLTHEAQRDLSTKPEGRRLVCRFESEETPCPSNKVGHRSTI